MHNAKKKGHGLPSPKEVYDPSLQLNRLYSRVQAAQIAFGLGERKHVALWRLRMRIECNMSAFPFFNSSDTLVVSSTSTV